MAHETHRCARLTPARSERALVDAAKAGDIAARDELVEAYLPHIAAVARIYRGSTGIDRVDLMQDGVVGLLRALQRYDPAIGAPFWAYASWWVRQAMQQLVSELARPVVLSDRAARQLARIKVARHRHLQASGHEPTWGELAQESGLTRTQVETLVVAERSARGLEEPIPTGEGAVGTLGDLLADPAAEAAYEGVPRRMEIEDVRGMLARLSGREQTILIGRFGLGCRELTLRELGSTLQVSAERIRQIEERALEKLRAAVDEPLARP
jgi:RNA polymerase sigma factor (sigma-70 family)